MKLTKAIILVSALFVLGLIHTGYVYSQDYQTNEKMVVDEELDEELRWLKAETYVITASRVMEEIKKAPASITVVTNKQIRQMGARDVADAITRAVPSVTDWSSIDGYKQYNIRGRGAYNTVLFMINNHSINRAISGTYHSNYDDLIIDNVQRIEFIRGPGSALYGANAYHGVINIITKNAEEIDGFELRARKGSWDTQQYNLLYGKRFGDLEVTCNFNYFKTDGFRGFIVEDRQTQLDEIWSPIGFPPASLAPGHTMGDREKFDMALNLKFKGFTLDGRYVDKEWDTPVGIVGALVERGMYEPDDYYLTLSYEAAIGSRSNFYGKVYRNENDELVDTQIFPSGFVTMTPTGPSIWQNGLLAFAEFKSERTGIDVHITRKTGDNHVVVAGASYEDQEASDYRGANYLSTAANVTIQLPSVQQWPDNILMGTETRNFTAVFLEDIWDITGDLRLTTGIRYDRYNDFGGHVSPRVGLTWEYMEGYDVKLLYGHAFRAPTFLEFYNPQGGNPDLEPEKLDTYEISLGAKFTSSMEGRITFFHIETADVITVSSSFPPYHFINRGSSRNQGVEIEMKYDFGRGTYLGGDYIFINQKTGLEENFCRGKIMTNIRLSRYLNFYADFNFQYGFHDRLPGDTKKKYQDVEIVNATLIAKKFLKGFENLEVRTSVYNLLDEDHASYQLPDVPFDLPMPDRNYLLEMKYSF